MREIKFQLIWKHEGKVVKETVSLDHLLESNPKAPRFTKGKLRVAAELLAKREFTGVKDKSGVEICEGDVLTCEDFYDDSDNLIVRYDDRGCFVATDRSELSDFYYLDDYDFVVIGNIYQNPELLEK